MKGALLACQEADFLHCYRQCVHVHVLIAVFANSKSYEAGLAKILQDACLPWQLRPKYYKARMSINVIES